MDKGIFIGREQELSQLNRLTRKPSASLAVICGRRRVGKSTLIQKWGESFSRYYEIQGLAPRPGIGIADQLAHFQKQVQEQFPKASHSQPYTGWYEAFIHLAQLCAHGKILLLLDEISWMGDGDPDFSGILKTTWDTAFKKNPKLIVVLCGSVSSWIQENILQSKDFVGRISMELTLGELLLPECASFWRRRKPTTLELIKILSVTGGVPKYLEEVEQSASADQAIARMCFQPTGFLFNEFDRIFSDLLNKRSALAKKVLVLLSEKNLSADEIAKKLKFANNGDFLRLLLLLEAAGFLARDYQYSFEKTASRLSRFRLKDNYLRFYFKYVLPSQTDIKNGSSVFESVQKLPGWDSIVGLQFENLILANRSLVYAQLGINPADVAWSGPYQQRKTLKNKGACQIDLMIITRSKTVYLCELKCRNYIDTGVIEEIRKKERLLKLPKRYSLRTALIYDADLSERMRESLSAHLDYLVPFEQLLKQPH